LRPRLVEVFHFGVGFGVGFADALNVTFLWSLVFGPLPGPLKKVEEGKQKKRFLRAKRLFIGLISSFAFIG
jgi:hypothetical protein